MQMQYKYCCKYVIVNEINAKAESVESAERAEKREIKWKKNHMIGSWSMFCDFLEENFLSISSGLCVMPVWGKTKFFMIFKKSKEKMNTIVTMITKK